jgi:hypothetical protein
MPGQVLPHLEEVGLKGRRGRCPGQHVGPEPEVEGGGGGHLGQDVQRVQALEGRGAGAGIVGSLGVGAASRRRGGASGGPHGASLNDCSMVACVVLLRGCLQADGNEVNAYIQSRRRQLHPDCEPIAASCEALMRHAYAQNGAGDNITIVAVRSKQA